MGKLSKKLQALQKAIKDKIYSMVIQHGVYNDHTIGLAIFVPKEITFYVEGRRISFIDEYNLIGEGLHYQHSCISIEDMVDLLEMIEVSKQVEQIQSKTKTA